MKLYLKSEGIRFNQNPSTSAGHGHIEIDGMRYSVSCEHGYYVINDFGGASVVPTFSSAFRKRVVRVELTMSVTDRDHMAMIVPGHYRTKSGEATAEVVNARQSDSRGNSHFSLSIAIAGTSIKAVWALRRMLMDGKAQPKVSYRPSAKKGESTPASRVA